MIICEVILNGQPKGEFFVVMRDDRDFLILPTDLKQMGLRELPQERTSFAGEDYVSLANSTEISFTLDEQSLTLALMAEPEQLGRSSVDLGYTRLGSVYYPDETSLFVNYGLNYTSNGDSSLDFQSFSFSNEIGFRFRNGLFLSDAIYTETPDENRWVRLNSQVVWDQRDRMRRLVFGDHTASSGDLGSRVEMGGISLSKIYRIDPYFIRYPLFDFSGMLTLPSEIEFYVDGVKLRTERFSPGEFELLNFQGIRGAQDIEVVIRDSFGREQVVSKAIYATDQVLRHGLHEYSYNLGFQRRDFGLDSNDYAGKPVFAGFHLYGLTDWVNLGGRAELSEDLVNLGAQSVLVAGSYGLFRLDGSISNNQGRSGTAVQLLYEYSTRHFNTRLGLQAYSTDYRTLVDLDTPSDRKLNMFASAGYLTAKLGSFGVRYLEAQYQQRQSRREINVSWSRRVLRQAYLSTSLSWVEEGEAYAEGSVNLTWRFGNDLTLTARHRHERDRDTQSLEAHKNTPSGYGTGWSLEAERVEMDSNTAERLNGFLQHNAQHAIMRADVSHDRDEFNTNTAVRVSLSGALVHVGNRFGLTRPVQDSFSLVSIGSAEDVRVYVNGQDTGRTNRNGQLFVPDLSSYYENSVSFEDKDIPLDYLMPQVKLAVSPPLRSGSCINFPLKRYQAFTGTFMIETAGENVPLQNAELVLQSSAGPVKFWTGGDGEFYLDSQMDELDILSVQGCEAAEQDSTAFLPASTYPVTVRHNGQSFETELTIPASDETFAELGTLTLPVLSGSPPEQAPATDQPPASEPEQALVEPEASIHETNQASELAEALPPLAAEAKQESTQPDPEAVDDALPRFTIHFPLDSSIPLPDDQATLDQALKYLMEHPQRPIDIEGHADQLGSADYNQKLGYWRAQALRDYLVNAGINPQRFSRIVSYGESKPLCRGTSEDCHRQNRRAIVLVAITPEN
ncbi:MAG: fimbria/pilus outer membrane usher protein [Desulfuromonadales bacterium]|nr:fimbria/pilus outer membrane usher protein [Desulfuromonadales bacterium]